MNLNEILLTNYELGSIQKIERSEHGSGHAYLVQTQEKKYIAKENERTDFVQLYDKVAQNLAEQQILQSKVIRTRANHLITPEGIALYEFLPGDNVKIFTRLQMENAIRFMRKYNEALATVPFDPKEIRVTNHWDQARSLEFTLNQFPEILRNSQLDPGPTSTILTAIQRLADVPELLAEEHYQLIHSDLGADNFMVQGDEVFSIIDFTPDYNHEIYSLCQFLYWNYIWRTPEISRTELEGYLKIYNFDEKKDIAPATFYLLLIRAAVYRIVGPLLDLLEKDTEDYNRLNKRIKLLDRLLTISD